ncbi:hypothetical protein JTE90_002462 [Oedothorax gibbosus]|uniref:RNase H type-1 domain-containing protein n=1 Tax=Oedothorax gibbosus TaxID=931172 RepID=A0AAV6UJH1_9ARAC|nr:hypothetical protein JTE90_002462 [Oedothorax gibbosus]
MIPANVTIHCRDFAFQNRNLSTFQIRNRFNSFRNQNRGSVFLATDASKSLFRVTVAAININNNQRISGELDYYYSINSAEAVAIILALQNYVVANVNYVLLTDSMTILRGLKRNSSLSVIRRLNEVINHVSSLSVSLKLVWVPSHKGIPENCLADKLAKYARARTIVHWIPLEDIQREEEKYDLESI